MEENHSAIKKKVFSGLIWRFLERIGVQGVQFAVSIVLARLLDPEDFGITGLIVGFIAIANVFVQYGYSTALVQKKVVDDEEFSTVFFFYIALSLVIYSILFFSAPLIADFYRMDILIPILRLLSLSIIMGAANCIHNVIISRHMQFRKSFFINLAANAAAGTVGIAMAINGYGVWSLVWSSLTIHMSTTLLLWLTICWRPKSTFSLNKMKGVFGYGSRILLSNLIDTIANNVYPLTIGKIFDKKTLGLYNKGQSIPSFIVVNMDNAIAGVMFPALSIYQQNLVRIKELIRRMLVTSTFLIFPMMAGIAVMAEPLVILLLTEKWIDAVPFVQLSCLSFAFWPVNTSNIQAINAIGRSDIYLRLEVIKKALLVIILIICIPFGVIAMVAGSSIHMFLCTVINAWPNKRLIGYSYRSQLADIAPSFLLSLAMCIPLFFIQKLSITLLVKVPLEILGGALFYFVMAYILKLECFSYLLDALKSVVCGSNERSPDIPGDVI